MLNVSCIQMDPVLADKEANIEKMSGFIDKVMLEQPDTKLIVFPEMITTGYECTMEQCHQLAEETDSGKSIVFFRKKCANKKVSIVFGYIEKDKCIHGVLYNSAVFIDENGNVSGNYRKTHPTYGEQKWCLAGRDLPVINTSFGKVGIMICWDAAFPEVARLYSLQGADLLIVPTNWEKPYSDDWDLVTRARAFDNTLHLISANRVGFDLTRGFFGHSNIISPVGNVIASLNEDVEGVIYSSIDLEISRKLRAEYYTFFRDSQPDLYRKIYKKIQKNDQSYI